MLDEVKFLPFAGSREPDAATRIRKFAQSGLQPSRSAQRRRLIRHFPGELRLVTTKVAVRGHLLIDRAQQVQHVDEAHYLSSLITQMLGNILRRQARYATKLLCVS